MDDIKGIISCIFLAILLIVFGVALFTMLKAVINSESAKEKETEEETAKTGAFKVSKTNVLVEVVSQYNFTGLKCYDDNTGRFICELRGVNLENVKKNPELKLAVVRYEMMLL